MLFWKKKAILRVLLSLQRELVQHGEANLRAHVGVQAERVRVGETEGSVQSSVQGARARCAWARTPP